MFSTNNLLAYIYDPSCVDPVNLPVRTGEQVELIDNQSDEAAKAKHKAYTPLKF